MRRLVSRLTLAGSLGLAVVASPLSAAPASASPIACASILPSGGGSLVATVCTWIMSGQVSGHLTPLVSGAVVDDLFLAQCNATDTACTTIPGSHSTTLLTPSFPAIAGQYYKTCAFFHVRQLTQTRNYSGCSPLATPA
jgi:hypothetical protein